MMSDLQLPDGFTLLTYDHIDSTNEEAKRLAVDHAPHGTIIFAKSQKQGHGRRGRTWVSEPGNLFCSIILKPDCPLGEASQLSFVMAVSVANALDQISVGAIKSQCKWPNDVLIDGKKVSGILLETIQHQNQQLDGIIAGVGINVMHHPSEKEFRATSLIAEGVNEVTAESVLESLSDHFARWYAIWRTEGFQTIRYAWLDKAFGVGDTVKVQLASSTYSGVFESLDPNGAMILNEDGNRRHIAAGDVYFDQATLENAV